MRFLICIYLALGVAQLGLAAFIATLGLREFAKDAPRHDRGEEALMIAAISAASAMVPLLAAFGLWRRWRVVWLVFLVVSGWGLCASTYVIVVSFAALIGLIDGSELGIDGPPDENLAIALGYSIFAAVQLWILLRPSVRQSFRRPLRNAA